MASVNSVLTASVRKRVYEVALIATVYLAGKGVVTSAEVDLVAAIGAPILAVARLNVNDDD